MARALRLLLDLTPLDTPARPRGIGRYIRELALGLAALPTQELAGVQIVGLKSLGFTGSYKLTDDIASHRGSPTLTDPTEADYYRWAYRQRFGMWRAAMRAGAGAVHLCDPHATPLFFGLTACARIVTCHDLVPTRFPDHYLGWRDGGAFVGRQIEKRRYRTADLVVAISDATRDDVRSLLGVAEHRVVRVHNGIDIDRWATEPPQPAEPVLARLGVKRPFLLYVGGSDWRKNAEGMMAGLAHAHNWGIELDLVWAGHLDVGHIEAVEAVARRFGVMASVRRLGYVNDDDLCVLYRTALAHLFVSRCEGFGLTVVEAMAAGCPVIAAEGGALSEVAGNAALSVNPEDHTAIGGAIVRLCLEPALRTELSLRGKERAPLFSRQAQARAMVRIYRDVLQGQ